MRRHTVHGLGSASCVVVAVALGACDGGAVEAPGVAPPAVRIAAESADPAAPAAASASASASDSASDAACGRTGDRCLSDAQCCGGFTCEDFPEGSACVAYTEPDPQATDLDDAAAPVPADAVATSDDDLEAKACGRTGDTCLTDAACCGGFLCRKFPEGRVCVAYAEPDPQVAVASAVVVVVAESACGRAGDLCRTDGQCCGGFICQQYPEGRACAAYTEPDPDDASPAGGYRETTTHPR